MEPQNPQPILAPSKRSAVRWVLFLLLVLGGVAAVLVLPRIFAELKYPLAYEDLIVQESIEHDLDPFLVAAVIYAESRYLPTATSPVGARGLMQLMPQTAAGIARRMNDTSYTVDKLYDPATNIEYGTFHLQGLMGRYDSNEAPAIVAYNGGGGAGDRYLAGERAGSVPGESLRYVEKVLAAKSVYQELYPARLSSQRDLAQFFQPAAQEPLVNVLLRAVQSAVASRLQE